MKKLVRVLTGLVMTALAAPAANAAVLYYGGDPGYFIPGYYYVAEDMFYASHPTYSVQSLDNFIVPTGETWTVTGLFSMIGNPGVSTPLNVDWQIRTGVSSSSLGTLIAGGTNVASTETGNSFNVNGNTGQTLSVDLATPLMLSGGQTYWLSIQPITSTLNLFIGGTTAHANGVGGANDNFSILSDYDYYGTPVIQTAAFDLSQGVTGTKSTTRVPEGPTFALMLAGLAGFGALRRRKARNA